MLAHEVVAGFTMKKRSPYSCALICQVGTGLLLPELLPLIG